MTPVNMRRRRSPAPLATQPVTQPEHVPADAESLAWGLIESVTEYAIFAVAPDGKVVTWNAGAERSFGYRRDEILGRHFATVFTPRDRQAREPQKELLCAEAKGNAQSERWHVRKDGSRFWGTSVVQPIGKQSGGRAAFTMIVRDTTKVHDAAEALRENERRLRLLVESVTDYAIFALSGDGRIMQWNVGAERLFGYFRSEVIGTPYDRLFDAEDVRSDAPQRALEEATRNGSATNERWLVRKDHSLFFGSGKLTRFRDDSGDGQSGFVSVVHDITARKRLEDEMRHQAFHDSLTRLPNRALFVEHVRHTIARSERKPLELFAVIFLDLDNFKLLNDSFGHAFADQALVLIAERLASLVRAEDVVARIGGDEFAMLVGDLASPSDALGFAERLQLKLADPFVIDGHEIFASASLGIAMGGSPGDTPDRLLRDADIAMYSAKSRGRSNHAVFDAAMHAHVLALHHLETDLRHASDRNELRLAYQPIVSLGNAQLVGFEALVRWEHPTRGLLSPAEFIAAAEETGAIIGIDRWVLREACREVSCWNARHLQETPLALSVNFSTKQFGHHDLCDYIKGVLAETGLAPQALKIEVTENVLIERSPIVATMLANVSDLGVEIHVDDFGTGYSSLSYLRYLPVSVLKIDGSFVRTMQEDSESLEIVRTIVNLSHNLKLRSMAEGVESLEQLNALRQMSCEFGQGYYFSKPLEWQAASELAYHALPFFVCS